MTNHRSWAPLFFGIAFLLLPVLYVGSYFLLVIPGGRFVDDPNGPIYGSFGAEDVGYVDFQGRPEYYRSGERGCSVIFAPLEKMDRTLHPRKWQGYPTPSFKELEQRWLRGEREY